MGGDCEILRTGETAVNANGNDMGPGFSIGSATRFNSMH